MMDIRCRVECLRPFCKGVLSQLGVPEEDAATFTDCLLFANLRGIDSHGIIRLPFYVRRLEVGGTKPRPDIRVVQDRASVALVDGDEGLGQVV